MNRRSDRRGAVVRSIGNERGSVAIEAAIVLPTLICLCLAIVWYISLARTEAALREAVDEAVKTTAAHAYPADLLLHAYRNNAMVQSLEMQIEQMLPYSVKTILEERKLRTLPPVGQEKKREWSRGAKHEAWAEPFLAKFVDKSPSGVPSLDPDRIRVTAVLLPDMFTDETSYFGLAAEYRLTLPIPFVRPSIVLTASAVERCWVGRK